MTPLRLIFFGMFVTLSHDFIATATSEGHELEVVELRCDYLQNPLGIDSLQPRLSWRLNATNQQLRGKRQTAYQIRVASDKDQLLNQNDWVWDSGRVDSEQSHLIRYAGPPLTSRQTCWWQVRIWDESNAVSEWSAPGMWTMGLLDAAAWDNAQWIGLEESDQTAIELDDLKQSKWLWYPEGNAAQDAPVATRYFRREIVLPADRQAIRAHAFFAGDDAVEMFINHESIGIGRGHPNLVGEDISARLKPGVNQLAVAATNGDANVPANPAGWICFIRVEFEAGPPLVIYSDKGWKSTQHVEADWQVAPFDAPQWTDAMELGEVGMLPWGQPWQPRWQPEHRRLPGRYLRREFNVAEQKQVRRATAYMSGLGFSDLFVNGQLIGDHLMGPALTGYDTRIMVVTLDVTDAVRNGTNAMGVVLSNGRFFAPRSQNPMPMHDYGVPRLLGQLHIEYSDGTAQTLVTDERWRATSQGPLLASNEFDGEEYDGTKELVGWTEPNYELRSSSDALDRAGWQAAQILPAPGGTLESQMVEPIRITKVLEPVQIVEPTPGVWMIDFGQAFYGVVRLTVEGEPRTRVSMRTSFNVKPDGLLNYINDRSARNTDVYILNGSGVETWHPRFRGNATRWVQVEGFPGTPTKENFAGLATHTDHEPVGEFECSNPLINRIYSNATWGTRLQNRSVPMEPDRDERMPWSGHPAKTSESEGWVFGVAPFYEHFLHNYRVHQAEEGSLQEILPPYWKFNSKDIIWPSVVTIIPDWYHKFYGDDRLLRDNYDMMKRFVLYHEKTNLKPDGTMDHCIYGDWVDSKSIGANSRNFGATSRPLMGTAYLYNNCRIVERAARLFGNREDENYFHSLAERIYEGFNQRFFDSASGQYESGTQCSAILPLAFGLVPEQHREPLIKKLVDDIYVTHHGHTSVGLIGMQWQMQVLSEIGHADAAYQIATRTAQPSWGYMVEHGATTIWERWDTDTQDGGMNGESQKILSGNFEAWCYQTLAGINYDPEHPGFKHIVFKPAIVGDLEWTRASHICPYGKIESDWKAQDGRLKWRIVVPPNTTATAYIPTTNVGSLRESEPALTESPGVESAEHSVGQVVVELTSGTYLFDGLLDRSVSAQ